MKYIVLLVFIAFIATTTNASNLRSHTAVDTIASIMGKNSLYTSIVRSLKQDAPAKVIVNKMNELQAVLTTRLEHVKDGCEIDQKHFLQRLLIVSQNVTKVNASVIVAKKCIAEEIATEQDIGEEIQAELKTLVPHSKFESAKAHLSQIRKRATKLMKAHDARHDRYQKEQVMFKNQDKILSHVMGTIESYYKKKSVNKAAVQQSEHSVATVLLETVAPKSKVHRAVVTKLLEIVSNKTTTTPKKGTEEQPVVTKRKVSTAPKAAKSKVLAGTIYEAITELKGTFVNEQKIRTLRYETRKDEHVQEIQQLSKEEGDIKNEVTNYIASNKNITNRVNKMKFNLNKALDKQKECKKESTSLAVDLKKLQTRKIKRKFALNHTKTLCNAQIKDILKEVKLATYISGLISKRVKKIQEALQKFEKETSDVNGATGNGHATGSSGTGGANSVGDIENQIKNSEQCAKLGVAFWCKNEANMKQCGVSASDCKRMMKDNVAQDLTNDNSPTGNAAEDAHSIRKERMKKKKEAEKKRLATGSTGPSASGSTGSSTGSSTGISSGKQLQDAASTGTATGPSAGKSASSTGATGTATKNAQRQSDFQKLLKIFDQDKDQRIGWDEIIAVTGHEDPKMKREFQAVAGNDMKMNYKEFHKFMNNKGAKTGFFFM
jgi:hypothetical protein